MRPEQSKVRPVLENREPRLGGKTQQLQLRSFAGLKMTMFFYFLNFQLLFFNRGEG
jgi:hypothetical protein